MSKQPKALQMAHELRRAELGNAPKDWEVADELTRMHAINAEMLEALEKLLSALAWKNAHATANSDHLKYQYACEQVWMAEDQARAAIRKATEEA